MKHTMSFYKAKISFVIPRAHLDTPCVPITVSMSHLYTQQTMKRHFNILEVAKEQGINKFMYFSTFHIYGPNTGKKIAETQLPNPIHPYSITHYMAELYVNQYRQVHDFETAIIRLSNSFGAPIALDVDRWTLVVNDLCSQAIKNGQLKLNSSGEQHRDFIPLSDVLKAVDLLINTPKSKLDNGVFNVGAGYSISVKEMCNRIKKVYLKHYGKDLPIIIPKNAPKQDDKKVYYDISKIKKIGFKPDDNYESEILNTLKLCEKQ